MKKILFTDLDDTLLQKDKSVSKENQMAIRKLLEAGHEFVIATGRAPESVESVVESLKITIPRLYMLCYNGGLIYDYTNKKVCKEFTVPLENVKYLLEEAKAYGIYVQTYCDGEIIMEKDCKELQFYIHRNRMRYRLVENVFEALTKAPQKVLLIDLERKGKLQKFQEDHKEWAKGRCTSVFSCPEYLEYCPNGVDKGRGIVELCKLLDIPVEQTVAVGDEENDIPMIKMAGIGVAVNNAVEEAKKVADYVTFKDHENGAVAEVIEKFIL